MTAGAAGVEDFSGTAFASGPTFDGDPWPRTSSGMHRNPITMTKGINRMYGSLYFTLSPFSASPRHPVSASAFSLAPRPSSLLQSSAPAVLPENPNQVELGSHIGV
jgi:hypothetical protein